jgi:hypothetical protein
LGDFLYVLDFRVGTVALDRIIIGVACLATLLCKILYEWEGGHGGPNIELVGMICKFAEE